MTSKDSLILSWLKNNLKARVMLQIFDLLPTVCFNALMGIGIIFLLSGTTIIYTI